MCPFWVNFVAGQRVSSLIWLLPDNQAKSFSPPHICSINVDLFTSFHNTLVEKGFGAKASLLLHCCISSVLSSSFSYQSFFCCLPLAFAWLHTDYFLSFIAKLFIFVRKRPKNQQFNPDFVRGNNSLFGHRKNLLSQMSENYFKTSDKRDTRVSKCQEIPNSTQICLDKAGNFCVIFLIE